MIESSSFHSLTGFATCFWWEIAIARLNALQQTV